MITLSLSFTRENFSIDMHETIPSSGITAIFGRSGAGKTSIINMISGLLKPDSGLIKIGEDTLFDPKQNINLRPEKRQIGYVFQDARLFPHMTVEKNLKYGQKINDKDKYDEIISFLDLEAFLCRYPKELSGGEKQRVAIGRALLCCPKLLIMDEPTASLDFPRRQEIISYLLRLNKALQIPVLYVSHNLDEISQLADHMLLLDKGKIIKNGPLVDVWGSEHMRPWFSSKEQSSLLIGEMTGKQGEYSLTQLDVDGEKIWVPSFIEEKSSTKLQLKVFADDIFITKSRPCDSSIQNIIPVTIDAILPIEGSIDFCHVILRISKQTLLAKISQWAVDKLLLTPKQQVFAQIKNLTILKNNFIENMNDPINSNT